MFAGQKRPLFSSDFFSIEFFTQNVTLRLTPISDLTPGFLTETFIYNSRMQTGVILLLFDTGRNCLQIGTIRFMLLDYLGSSTFLRSRLKSALDCCIGFRFYFAPIRRPMSAFNMHRSNGGMVQPTTNLQESVDDKASFILKLKTKLTKTTAIQSIT